jgi:hypothetical protein
LEANLVEQVCSPIFKKEVDRKRPSVIVRRGKEKMRQLELISSFWAH